MSLRCSKILLPLFFITQSTFAQLPNILRNTGCHLPAPDIIQNINSQPTGNNFANNIPFAGTLPSGNPPANFMQTISKLKSINEQVGELLDFASNINRQLTGNNPPGLVQNPLINNRNLQTPSTVLPNTLASNNPYLAANSFNSNGNSLLNSVPNNNYIPAANANFLAFDSSNFQNNLPENNIMPFSNLPVNIPKINSLTLVGQAFNNGLPFSVVPANDALNSVNSIPINNFINYSVSPTNSLKSPRSLPSSDVPEKSYPAANNNIENSWISSWPNYPNEIQTTNVMPGNVPSNNILGQSVNNGLSLNLPESNHLTSNTPVMSPTNGLGAQAISFYNGESPSNFALNNFNNIQPKNEQFLPTAYQIPSYHEWAPPNLIQNKELTSNIFSQPTGNNFNLPDFTNANMLNLGDFGSFPIFSGLPVIGITETFIDPEQFYQNQVIV